MAEVRIGASGGHLVRSPTDTTSPHPADPFRSEAAMRIPSRVLLPLVAVVAAVAVVGTVAVARDRGWLGAAGPAAAAGTAANQAGGRGSEQPAAAAAGDPAGGAATAGLPRVTSAAATTDAVVIWNGSGRVPATAAGGERPRPGVRPQVRLDLAVTAAGGARAVVRVRNLTRTRLALTGTLQLLITGPGAATAVGQRLNRPLPGGATSAVSLPFQPANPGVYRVRAVFAPA
jgi:hypothetical protein